MRACVRTCLCVCVRARVCQPLVMTHHPAPCAHCRLRARRAALAPHVQQWQRYQSDMAQLGHRRGRYLRALCASLGHGIEALGKQARAECAVGHVPARTHLCAECHTQHT